MVIVANIQMATFKAPRFQQSSHKEMPRTQLSCTVELRALAAQSARSRPKILAANGKTVDTHIVDAMADNEVTEDNSEFVLGTALDTKGSDSDDLHLGVPGSRELGYQKTLDINPEAFTLYYKSGSGALVSPGSNAASACEKGEQWQQQTLELLDSAGFDGTFTDPGKLGEPIESGGWLHILFSLLRFRACLAMDVVEEIWEQQTKVSMSLDIRNSVLEYLRPRPPDSAQAAVKIFNGAESFENMRMCTSQSQDSKELHQTGLAKGFHRLGCSRIQGVGAQCSSRKLLVLWMR